MRLKTAFGLAAISARQRSGGRKPGRAEVPKPSGTKSPDPVRCGAEPVDGGHGPGRRIAGTADSDGLNGVKLQLMFDSPRQHGLWTINHDRTVKLSGGFQKARDSAYRDCKP